MNKEILEQIEKACRDMMAAEKLLEAKIYDYALFHSQQAVEKHLKAFLTFYNKPFGKIPRIHFNRYGRRSERIHRDCRKS